MRQKQTFYSALKALISYVPGEPHITFGFIHKDISIQQRGGMWVVNELGHHDTDYHYGNLEEAAAHIERYITGEADATDNDQALAEEKARMLESFRESLKQAMNGETYPIETLWDELDTDNDKDT